MHGAEITATRLMPHSPERVFELLSDLRNHWRLDERFVEVDALDSGATRGRVRIRGPLGLSRLATTEVLEVEAPRALYGRATLGNTQARIAWRIEPRSRGARVTLSGVVYAVTPGDRLLLACGARLWLAALFRNALATLDAELGNPAAARRSTLDWIEDGLTAGAVATALGGFPSITYALARGRDPLEATLAAGSILLPRTNRRGLLLAAAVPMHIVLSIAWALVLSRLLPAKRTTLAGAVSGLAIAALDLGVVGRRFPRVRALSVVPQVADHVAYGATVGAVLASTRER